jgi:hypothetical protein
MDPAVAAAAAATTPQLVGMGLIPDVFSTTTTLVSVGGGGGIKTIPELALMVKQPLPSRYTMPRFSNKALTASRNTGPVHDDDNQYYTKSPMAIIIENE